MSAQKRVGTRPELEVRKLLHAMGFRYRVDAPLPGLPRRRADLLFSRRRVAVFIDGCFWHACPVHATRPKANAEWWEAKLLMNVARDRATDEHLVDLGWRSLRFWEHANPLSVARAVASSLREQSL
jgi:DNA mismatch endonuclease (patch repair protein)